jgi:DNA-binding MarR family transcriptional regulator
VATAAACTALADAIADLTRAKRSMLGAQAASTLFVLHAVQDLGRPRISDLAEHLNLDVSTVSRHVASLRREGLLAAVANQADGRSRPITLTADGEAELCRLRQGLSDRLVSQLHSWDDATVSRLAALLHDFVVSTSPTGTNPAGSTRT